ncbi:MAG: hypothetical protein NTX45_22675 [Proteobacteria bacterium]|nr:hypothetical protein [Pseudomonadota bacterium]
MDVVGLIPVAGELSDGANALLYAAEGDKINAAISLTAMAPLAGDAVTAGKWAMKGVKKIEKEAEEAAAKKLAKEAEEAAAKKAAKEAEEKAAKGGYVEGRRKFDPCKVLENGIPTDSYRGGKHGAIQKGGSSYIPPRESHHVPSDNSHKQVGTLSTNNAPSIQMDKADHQKTASWGNTPSAKAYRNSQASLLKNGKMGFMAAIAMDITDIRSKFGNKYDGAIAQMLAWAKCKKYM